MLPPAPEPYRRLPGEFAGGRDYVSVNAFSGTARRKGEPCWVGSSFHDADLVDYLIWQVVDVDELREHVTQIEGEKNRIKMLRRIYKDRLHSMSDDELSSLLDAHRRLLLDAFRAVGVSPTSLTCSGYGHHGHLWLLAGLDDPGEQEALWNTQKALNQALNREVGFCMLDAGAQCGASQLCRAAGSVNRKGAQPRAVEIVWGDADARWDWRQWKPPEKPSLPPSIRARASRVDTLLTGLTAAERRKAEAREKRMRQRVMAGAYSPKFGITKQGRISPDVVVKTAGGGMGALGSLRTPTSIFCPQHKNTKSAAAAVHLGASGDRLLTCHGACSKTWLVADEPQRHGQARYVGDAGPVEVTPPNDGATDEASAAGAVVALLQAGDSGKTPLDADGPEPDGKRKPRRPRPPTTGRLSPRSRRQFATVLDRDVADGRYVRDDLLREHSAPLAGLKGPPGMGKTHLLGERRWEIEAATEDATFLAITHRRSLTADLTPRLGLKHIHVDPDGKVRIDRSKIRSLGLCVNSLRCIEPFLGSDALEQYDAVFIDEVEAVLPHLLLTKNMSATDRQSAYGILRNLLRRWCRELYIADANLSDYSLKALAGLYGVDVEVMLGNATLIHDKRERQRLSPLEAVSCDKPEDVQVVAMRLATAGRPFWLHVGSKALAQAICRELRAVSPDRVWALVTGDHDDDMGRAFLADVNGWIREHRGSIGGVVFTSALESGVSADEELAAEGEHDRLLGEYRGDIVLMIGGAHQTWQQLSQAVCRPRRGSLLVYHAPNKGIGCRWASPDEHLQAIVQGRQDTRAVAVKCQANPFTGPRKQEVSLIDAEHARAFVDADYHVSKSRESVGLDFTRWLVSQGHKVTLAEDGAAEEARAAVAATIELRRGEIDEEFATAVLSSDGRAMSVAEARSILEGYGDDGLRPVAHRVLMQDFYGIGAMSPETVALDDGGKFRRKVDCWGDMVAMGRGRNGRLAALDRIGMHVTAGAENVARRCTLSWMILLMAGITPDMIEGVEQGKEISFRKDKKNFRFKGVELGLTDAHWARLMGWLSVPVVRDAIRNELHIDPWKRLPNSTREMLESEPVCGTQPIRGMVSSYKDTAPRIGPPTSHQLGNFLGDVVKTVGLQVHSHRVTVNQQKHVRRYFDLDQARLMRAKGALRLYMLHGMPTRFESVDAMIANQSEERRIADRERVWERASEAEVQEMLRRHSAEESQHLAIPHGVDVLHRPRLFALPSIPLPAVPDTSEMLSIDYST